MQLWLKEISSEYAMNKPPEEEIWPNAREIKKIPRRHTVIIERGEIQIEVDEDCLEKENESDNIHTDYIRWYRTHCRRCWEKYEGGCFLHAQMSGHEAIHCKADSDDRFPREG